MTKYILFFFRFVLRELEALRQHKGDGHQNAFQRNPASACVFVCFRLDNEFKLHHTQ